MNAYPDTSYLRQIAVYAGGVMRDNFQLGMKRENKADNTPLTETDTAINRYVCQKMERDFPHVRVIGEEESLDVPDAEYTLLCDPVDGTIPFCRGTPISSFVISVIKGNEPLAAVIYDPFMDRMWHSTKGQGTFMNNQRAHVSTHDTVHRSNICMVWWNKAPFNLHAVAAKLMGASAIVGNPLSIAYFGGLLASGEQDATIFPGTKGWETAAMQLIAEEAGGKVTDIHGNPMVYGPNGEIEGHIISNGLIHDDLVEIVSSCQALQTV